MPSDLGWAFGIPHGDSAPQESADISIKHRLQRHQADTEERRSHHKVPFYSLVVINAINGPDNATSRAHMEPTIHLSN